MTRVSLCLLGFAIAELIAAGPAIAGGCCGGIPAQPKVIYATAPQPAYAAPPAAPAPAIASFKVNLGPYVTGLDLDAEGYPPRYYYPSQPALGYPYVRGDDFRYAGWPSYDPPVYRAHPAPRYRPFHPRRQWSDRVPGVWK